MNTSDESDKNLSRSFNLPANISSISVEKSSYFHLNFVFITFSLRLRPNTLDLLLLSFMSNDKTKRLAKWVLDLHLHNNYREKHANRISEIRLNLENALRENNFEEVGRLALALFDHSEEIIFDSELTCNTIIKGITALDKGSLPPKSVMLDIAASRAEKNFSEWQRRNQSERRKKDDEDSPSSALDEDIKAKSVSSEQEEEVSKDEQEVPNEVDDESSLALEEAVATTSPVGATDCQGVQENKDTITRRNWLSKVLGGWGGERAALTQAASTVDVHETEETSLDQVSVEVVEEEAASSSEVIESQDDSAAAEVVSLTSAEDGNETAAVTDSTEHSTVDNEPSTATAVATNSIDDSTVNIDSGTATSVATNSTEHLTIDTEPFIRFIDTFDKAETKTLTAAIDLQFLRLPQVLVALLFKKQEGLCLYDTLEQVVSHTLCVMGPLSTLNGVVGAFLLDEATKMKKAATKMKKVVNMRQAGMGSIISCLEKSTSGEENEGESPSVRVEVMAVKEALYRATHGNYGSEVDEEVRSTINNAVSNSQLEKHVNIGHATNNLITNVLDSFFIVFVMSKLSILQIYQHLPNASSLIESLKEFAQAVKPGVVCDVDMKGIEFLFIYAVPAMKNENHYETGWKVINSLLCSVNKIVSVNNNASAEEKESDPRKRELLSTFRRFEIQTSNGTVDLNAAVYYSGTKDKHSRRRMRAIRFLANQILRRPIEECVPPDTFSEFGYTQFFLRVSPSAIGKKCTYIKPELYSKCKDIITTQIIGELKTTLENRDNAGKQTIFLENEEQLNSLKQLVKIYEALQSD